MAEEAELDFERFLQNSSSSSSSSSTSRAREEEVTAEDEAAKRRRLLGELVFNQNGDDEEDVDDGVFRPVDYDEIVNQEYEDCYACNHINKGSLRDNEVFRDMIRMYTDNAASTMREASYRQIKEKFDAECRQYSDCDWTLDQIREHFQKHTQYPTDEVLNQLRIAKNLRDKHLKTLLSKRKNAEGKEEIQSHANNMKLLLSIHKEIRDLMLSVEHIPKMVGYDTTLNF